MPGLKKMNFGDRVQSAQIEKYKGVEGVRDVIAVLSKKEIFAAQFHYVQGLGPFYCFEGSCCVRHRLPQVKTIVPIVKYAVRDQHRLDRGLPISVQYLSLSKSTYDEFIVKDEIHGGISKHDLLVQCSDANFQKLSFEVIPGTPQWKVDPEIKTVVMREFDRYMNLIEMSIARMFTPEQYEAEYAKIANDRPMTASGSRTSVAVPDTYGGSQQTYLPVSGQVNGLEDEDLSDLMDGDVTPPAAAAAKDAVIDVTSTPVVPQTGVESSLDVGDLDD